eukprot:CAMPEP_0183320092 /NCGR_PEP_ID=MMETSP0160_2-20130417/65354_1 /TAXON_ID=2839 ORGANISM="Odontella Sinensis, Strain Grunow 1884" /NCGR_SAMPLE_ID=MMETSP0160_2 /ASSEMBLY_ACC=CAM_ASM_000250 /LENGTH=1192 /DNA_ID=CAMNT_0025486709 /DNA_START=164 /DNA_END=3742 /DNA_ORIENTATION=+
MGCAQSKPDDLMDSSVHRREVAAKRKPQTGSAAVGAANGTAREEKSAPEGYRSAPPTNGRVNPASEASTSSTNSAHLNGGRPGSARARYGDSGNSGNDAPMGYSSGASTPADDQSADDSVHRRGSLQNPKGVLHSNSVLGLDKMIEDRKGDGDLKTNVVHIEVPFGKPIEEVYEGVHDGPVLGSGISGLVRLITHKSTGVKYAVKCLDLGLVETEEGLQQLREEIYIMCQLDHPNIVRLEEVYESHSEIYLVQELCLGGELFDRLDEQPDYHYTEAQCARLVKQMLCSVRYIHSKGIIHRDLKLENFLFSSNSPDSELKMIDFGLSKHFKFGEVQHEAVGTPYTVAPEVIRGCYDERCDVWAIGVITFLLLSGDPPFGGCGGPEPLMQVRENILRGFFEFEPPEIWDNVSDTAKNFIQRMLVTDPNRRPTAREAQKAKWLKEWANRDRRGKFDNELNPEVVKALVNFKEYSDMRKLLCEVLSFTLLPDQIEDLRREFEKLDTDGSGEISLAGLKQVLMNNAGAGSLGALTEEEVEDIFNAMRVRKTETRIHWHEFIAAGLSQCKVDDRNLKLAFDRLDSDHKGYITFDNVMDLLGNDPSQSEDAMRRMWGDSMEACNCKHARIYYEDFLLLMKGQTKQDEMGISNSSVGSGLSASNSMGVSQRGFGMGLDTGLDVVHEGDHHTDDEHHSHAGSSAGVDDVVVLPSGDVVAMNDGSITAGDLPAPGSATYLTDAQRSMSGLSAHSHILPKLPPPPPLSASAPSSPIGLYGKGGDIDDMSDEPLMMDDEDNIDEMISEAADKSIMLGLVVTDEGPDISYANDAGNLTPPQSPRRGAVDYITPISQREKLSPASLGGAPIIPDMPSPAPALTARGRSKSVDAQDHPEEGENSPMFASDTQRALLLPEHTHNQSEIEQLIKDETKTPLVVNRKLYRAHRQMRLSVLEASKRFEEQQIARTKKMIDEQKRKVCGAGLTMRHGLAKEMSSDSIRKLLRQQQRQQQTIVDKANKQSGRGRRTRKKTISDMTGFMSGSPGDMIMDAGGGGGPSGRRPAARSAVIANPKKPDLDRNKTEGANSRSNEPLRRPTTPGVFRKTVDPFQDLTTNKPSLNRMSTAESARHVLRETEELGLRGSGLGFKPPLEAVGETSDASNHSSAIRSSRSDGNINKQKDPASPSASAEKREETNQSWPPPPPL